MYCEAKILSFLLVLAESDLSACKTFLITAITTITKTIKVVSPNSVKIHNLSLLFFLS